jgi:molybdopterin-binding protein
MALSARNQLEGTVRSVKLGEIVAEVTIELDSSQTVVSVITRGSADALGLKQGDRAKAVIKATEVMVAKD